MTDNVTNELIFEHMKRMHGSIKDMDVRLTEELHMVNDKLDAMREHVGAQQMDIATLYRRVEYLSGQIDNIKAQLSQLPQSH